MQPLSSAMRSPLKRVASGILLCAGFASTTPAVAIELPSLHTSLLHNSDIQGKNVSRHLTDLRQSSASQTKSSGEKNASLHEDRFSLFLAATSSDGEQDSTEFETGYDEESDHYTVGTDFRVSKQWLAGVAYGYSESDLSFNNGDPLNRDLFNSESDFFTLYSSWYRRDFAVDMSLGYSDTRFSTQKALPGADAFGETGSHLISLHLSGAFDFYSQGLTYGPLAALDMLNGHIDAFTEQGNGTGYAQFDEQDVRSAILSMGAQTAYAQHFSWGSIVPQAKGIARYQIDNDRRHINGHLVLDPDQTITLLADKPDTTWFEFSAALSAVFARGFSLYVHYEAIVDYSATNLQTISAGLRADF